MTDLERIAVPASMPEIGGAVAGGCVDGGRRFRRWAHAHNRKGRPYFGWVCFLGRRRIWNAKGEPSDTFWHEYAHILTPDHGHDDAWRATMRRLGRPLRAHEKKVTRRRHVWEDKGPSQVNIGMTEYVCADCGAWKLARRRTTT